MQAPDVTQSAKGRELVTIMARGLLEYMERKRILIPETFEAFESGIVTRARNAGLDGRIAFLSPNSLEGICKLFGVDPKDTTTENQRKLDLVNIIANTIYPKEERVNAIREFGPDFEHIATAFENRDCQRRLVYKAMKDMQLTPTQALPT